MPHFDVTIRDTITVTYVLEVVEGDTEGQAVDSAVSMIEEEAGIDGATMRLGIPQLARRSPVEIEYEAIDVISVTEVD